MRVEISGLCLVLGLLLAGGCSRDDAVDEVTQGPARADAPATPALIPRDAIFSDPARAQARISPDGSQLSWLAPRDGVLNVWVAPTTDIAAARPLTNDRGRGIRMHFWAPGGAHVLYLQDRGGNENNHVYAVQIGTGEVRDLTPVAEDVRATLQGLSRERPGVVLVGLNDRDPSLEDLYEIDISTGERVLIAQNPGFSAWAADNSLRPRLALRPQPGGAQEVLAADADGNWQPFTQIAADDVITSDLVGFDRSNDALFMISSEGRDKAALYRWDLASGERTLLAVDDRADVGSVLRDPVTYEPLAYSVNFTRQQWTGLNDGIAAELEFLGGEIAGDLQFADASNDGKRIILYANAAQDPGAYYLYQRDTRAITRLFSTRPALEGAPLQPMQALALKSRDGLALVSYLTLPPGADGDGDGRPEAPLPMVLYVHGGPWARDSYGYNTVHQWLANRGYAVLSVNYRGSTGFGKLFLNAAVREFAGRMHDDLLDAVGWAVSEKIADAGRVAIMGGSYGGYATLVGVTFTPSTFACGVDIVGPSSLITLVESFPAYWAPFLESSWYRFVGNPEQESDRADMFNRSPISRVDDIQVPLLIGQGENDPRVTKQESDQLVAAMDARELPVTYVNYPDEGHGFARPENRMSFFAVSEAFLNTCVGGRFEPIGSAFAGSSIDVLHGADYVPGLPAALQAHTRGD
jgi:dipeptidyl aminopeptidase/acylaminoacyl peptidase